MLPVLLSWSGSGGPSALAQALPMQTQTFQCGPQLALVMDASFVKSSKNTQLDDSLVVEIVSESFVPSGRYILNAVLQGDLGGMTMTTWRYKNADIKFRLMTTSQKPEPHLYVAGQRLICRADS